MGVLEAGDIYASESTFQGRDSIMSYIHQGQHLRAQNIL